MDEGTNGLMADTLISGTTLVEKESRSIGDVPIGGIVAWAKSLSGVPNLAEGWVECDGAVLVDALSPLNGQTIPDLNGGEFLEGRATSGATGGAAANVHTLNTSGGGTTNRTFDTKVGYIAGSGANSKIEGSGATGGGLVFQEVTATTDSVENRPPFYTVVWIMRVR